MSTCCSDNYAGRPCQCAREPIAIQTVPEEPRRIAMPRVTPQTIAAALAMLGANTPRVLVVDDPPVPRLPLDPIDLGVYVRPPRSLLSRPGETQTEVAWRRQVEVRRAKAKAARKTRKAQRRRQP